MIATNTKESRRRQGDDHDASEKQANTRKIVSIDGSDARREFHAQTPQLTRSYPQHAGTRGCEEEEFTLR